MDRNEGSVEGRVGMEGLDGRMDGMTNKAISQYRNYINSPACLAYLIIKTDFTHDGLNYCEAKTKQKIKIKIKRRVSSGSTRSPLYKISVTFMITYLGLHIDLEGSRVKCQGH